MSASDRFLQGDRIHFSGEGIRPIIAALEMSPMHEQVSLWRIGQRLFAAAMIAFGLHYLLATLGRAPAPGPPWFPGSTGWAYGVALVFVAAGACLLFPRTTRAAAFLLSAFLILHFVLGYLPRLIANLHDPGPWTSGFEVLGLAGGALALAQGPWNGERVRSGSSVWTRIPCIMVALLLAVVGTQHFLYARFVSTLIPSWIPARLFWTYFVGVAFFGAALALVSGRRARLAATLLGIMFFSWVLIVHAPRVAAALHGGNDVTSFFVALAMSGTSFALAGMIGEQEKSR